MTSTPSTTTPEIDTDEDEASWTDFLYAAVCYVLAVVPFTPLWDQLADPEASSGRRRGLQRLLAEIGPLPVTLVFAGVGTALLLMVLAQRRKAVRDSAAAGA